MKGIYIFTVLVLFGCVKTTKEIENNTVPHLDWLIGDWVRTNGEPAENTYEIWKKSDDGYTGEAYTIVAEDTVFQEVIKAYLEDDKWHYVVSGLNETPVTFTSSLVTDSSFVCENMTNEFPKTIAYTKDGDCINATISNSGDKEILFRYEKRVR